MGVEALGFGGQGRSARPGEVIEMPATSGFFSAGGRILSPGFAQGFTFPSARLFPEDKPLFGKGLEGARKLVAYEQQVLGVSNHEFLVTEQLVVKQLLHNCMLCWASGVVKRAWARTHRQTHH